MATTPTPARVLESTSDAQSPSQSQTLPVPETDPTSIAFSPHQYLHNMMHKRRSYTLAPQAQFADADTGATHVRQRTTSSESTNQDVPRFTRQVSSGAVRSSTMQAGPAYDHDVQYQHEMLASQPQQYYFLPPPDFTGQYSSYPASPSPNSPYGMPFGFQPGVVYQAPPQHMSMSPYGYPAPPPGPTSGYMNAFPPGSSPYMQSYPLQAAESVNAPPPPRSVSPNNASTTVAPTSTSRGRSTSPAPTNVKRQASMSPDAAASASGRPRPRTPLRRPTQSRRGTSPLASFTTRAEAGIEAGTKLSEDPGILSGDESSHADPQPQSQSRARAGSVTANTDRDVFSDLSSPPRPAPARAESQYEYFPTQPAPFPVGRFIYDAPPPPAAQYYGTPGGGSLGFIPSPSPGPMYDAARGQYFAPHPYPHPQRTRTMSSGSDGSMYVPVSTPPQGFGFYYPQPYPQQQQQQQYVLRPQRQRTTSALSASSSTAHSLGAGVVQVPMAESIEQVLESESKKGAKEEEVELEDVEEEQGVEEVEEPEEMLDDSLNGPAGTGAAAVLPTSDEEEVVADADGTGKEPKVLEKKEDAGSHGVEAVFTKAEPLSAAASSVIEPKSTPKSSPLRSGSTDAAKPTVTQASPKETPRTPSPSQTRPSPVSRSNSSSRPTPLPIQTGILLARPRTYSLSTERALATSEPPRVSSFVASPITPGGPVSWPEPPIRKTSMSVPLVRPNEPSGGGAVVLGEDGNEEKKVTPPRVRIAPLVRPQRSATGSGNAPTPLVETATYVETKSAETATAPPPLPPRPAPAPAHDGAEPFITASPVEISPLETAHIASPLGRQLPTSEVPSSLLSDAEYERKIALVDIKELEVLHAQDQAQHDEPSANAEPQPQSESSPTSTTSNAYPYRWDMTHSGAEHLKLDDDVNTPTKTQIQNAIGGEIEGTDVKSLLFPYRWTLEHRTAPGAQPRPQSQPVEEEQEHLAPSSPQHETGHTPLTPVGVPVLVPSVRFTEPPPPSRPTLIVDALPYPDLANLYRPKDDDDIHSLRVAVLEEGDLRSPLLLESSFGPFGDEEMKVETATPKDSSRSFANALFSGTVDGASSAPASAIESEGFVSFANGLSDDGDEEAIPEKASGEDQMDTSAGHAEKVAEAAEIHEGDERNAAKQPVALLAVETGGSDAADKVSPTVSEHLRHLLHVLEPVRIASSLGTEVPAVAPVIAARDPLPSHETFSPEKLFHTAVGVRSARSSSSPPLPLLSISSPMAPPATMADVFAANGLPLEAIRNADAPLTATDSPVDEKRGTNSYPSPPASDVDVNELPTMIQMSNEELVRSESSDGAHPAVSTSRSPITFVRSHLPYPPRFISLSAFIRRASPKPQPAHSQLSPRTRLTQLEIATTIQTIPQETGFWSILGPFLIDMTLEIFWLLWFFLSEVLAPRIWVMLVFIASPVLVGISVPLGSWNQWRNTNARTPLTSALKSAKSSPSSPTGRTSPRRLTPTLSGGSTLRN